MGATVLVIGGGGREHALAWKLSRSPHVARVVVAPGNGGTATEFDNADVSATDLDGLVALARRIDAQLTVVGPEAPLTEGVVDRFEAEGLRIFGPCKAAARLEGSKAFAKAFMEEHGVPTARWRRFDHFADARLWLESEVDFQVVVKASGLAAGKGVIVCDSREDAIEAAENMLVHGEFGAAGREIVIEERLVGPEVSLLCLSDGHKMVVMPPAQDHKRVGEGDVGPNTGGMGAYAPAPVAAGYAEAWAERTLRPILEAFAHRGTPYKGVLYAGLILTERGPKVLEYNCRFGDPETQVLLPLIDSDLYELMSACVDGRLGQVPFEVAPGVAATVVAASEGYPGDYPSGRRIEGLDAAAEVAGATVFHAGTRAEGDHVVTSGGRVLSVTGTGPTLRDALARAYDALGAISFDGMHFRRDIGWRALEAP